MGSKFNFFQQKIHFYQFIVIDKYLKLKEIAYFIHYIKFEMWVVLFYVNYLWFQQWNSNWDIAFFNSSLDSKLEFLNAGLRLYFKHFPSPQEYWKLGFLNVALVGLLIIFPIHERDEILGVLNVSLGCTSKFLPIHWEVMSILILLLETSIWRYRWVNG